MKKPGRLSAAAPDRQPPLAAGERRHSESGFALLFVFALAAAIAWMVYLEIPRIAFEAQREKEELLITRGEEYRRAIQLYVRKFNAYPASLDQLEKTNNIRFLRRRYADPMTGKDEWRLIRVGPGGALLDSLTQKPDEGKDKDKQKDPAEMATQQPAAVWSVENPSAAAAGAPVSPALRRRASEGAVAGPADQPGVVAYPADPSQPVSPYPQPVQPGQQQPYLQQAQPNQPVYPYPQPVQPGQQQPYLQQAQPGQPVYPYPQPAQLGQQQPHLQQAQPGQLVYPYPQPAQLPQQPYPYTQQVQPGQYPYPIPQPGQAAPTYPPAMGVPFYQPQQPPGQQIPYPTQNIPGLPGPYGTQPASPSPMLIPVPGAPASSQAGGVSPTPYQYQPVQPYPYSTQPGVGGAPAPGQPKPPFQQPGYQPVGAGQPQNPALEMIRTILTTPRPGGLTGVQPQGASGGQIMGGGIAGVASKLEAEGIKVYNDRTKYNEWEFIYDPRKDPARLRQLGAAGIPLQGQAPAQRTAPPPGR